jgi:hypothetical protein
MFSLLSSNSTASRFFLEHVHPDVDWTAMGVDYPLAGHWTSRDEFLKDAFEKMHAILDDNGLQLDVQGIYQAARVNEENGGEDEGYAIVELKARGKCKNGGSPVFLRVVRTNI